MAAALGSASAIDLSKPSSFHIRLGASVTSEGTRYRNVRYNHKPRSAQGAAVTSKLLPGKQANGSALLLNDGDKGWRYNGRHKDDEDMYVLVLSGDGKKEVTLERLGSSHAVNLTKTPEDKDEEALARKYPYLTDDESENDDEGMFGDEEDAEDAEPDPNNPFDFRLFLKSVEETPREEPTSQPNRSTVGTPIHRAATSTPIQRPSKPTPAAAAVKKRKTPSAAATRPNPKRVRAGEDPPNAKAKPAASKTEIPEVRIDRKASHAKTTSSAPKSKPEPDYEDDGELILENSTDNAKQNPSHLSAMSLALSGALGSHGSGPISLRSAASSPGINSPQPNSSAAQGRAEGEEFDLGGGSSPAAEQYEFEFVDDDDDGDEDGQDGDVEDLELPSPEQREQPRQPAMPSRSRRGSLAGPVGDDDDDMEAQLALAMAAEEDDDDAAPAARVDESDEDVSEEE